MQRLALTLLLGLFATTLSADQSAVDLRLKAGTCLGCHAVPSYTNVYPSYRVPKLAGQHAEYIVAALKAYKTKERAHSTMHAQAIDLSEQDMLDLAKYFSSQPKAKSEGAIGADTIDQAKLATCAACHTDTGNSITPINPILAGQHRDYLYHAMQSYKTGERKNAIMAGIVAGLSEQDMQDFAVYFSKNKGLEPMSVGPAVSELSVK